MLARKFAEDRTKFVQEGLKPAAAAVQAKAIEGTKRFIVERSVRFTSRCGQAQTH